jgi:subtilisin-like proprotein convertase family protein
MRKSLLILVGYLCLHQNVSATTCGNETVIPAGPTMPYTQSLTCGGTNDINSGNAVVCGSGSYLGGQEALYSWTPVVDYTGVSIAYSGQTWTGIFIYQGCPTSGGVCVANVTSGTSSKTLNVPGTLTAGVTYFIIFDTYPSPVSPCPGTFTLNGTPNIATPPTPTQAPGVPDCVTGTTIDVTGSPEPNVEWYWQSAATGTSQAELYAGPYTVMSNGTYYLRAFHTVLGVWSASASSVTVADFPTAPLPPVPTAASNPACITTGTSISVPPATLGLEYYWQGTDPLATSQLENASSDYLVAVTGTYYVRTFEVASSCWSDASGILVTINSFIPEAPTASITDYFICSGSLSNMIEADVQNIGNITLNSGPLNIPIPDNNVTGISSILTTSGIPVGSTVLEMSVTLNIAHTFNGDLDIYFEGPNGTTIDLSTDNGSSGDNYVNCEISSAGVTSITSAVAPMTGTFAPEQSFAALYSQLNGDWILKVSDDSGLDLGTLQNWSFNISYMLPPATIEWFDASAGGVSQGTGTTFESIGTSLLASPAPTGTYLFYAESNADGCPSTSRLEVIVNVDPVNITMSPVAVTCNNGNDGTLTVDAIQCGVEPFMYSIDGGAFESLPTNLTVGNHDVVVRDATMAISGTYVITIGDAPAPGAITVDDFNYDMVEFSWSAGGSETVWYVEWGLAGFTPGTGSEVGSAMVSSPTHIATGLDGYTLYDFYVSANCGGLTVPGIWVSSSQLTLCDPIVAQGFCETFDSDSPTEACWTVLNLNGDGDAFNMNGTTNVYSGDENAQITTDLNAGNNDDWLIMPLMTLTNNEILSFYYRVNNTVDANDFEVRISTTGMDPADFTDVLLPLTSYTNTTYVNQTIDLSAFGGDCYIAFHIPSGGADGSTLYIDQVCIDICIPDPGIDGSENVCRLDNTVDLNSIIVAGESNGIWEFLPNPGVVIGSDLNVGLLPDGTYEIEYIVTTACTTDTTIAVITVFPASSAGIGSTISDICSDWSSINLVDGLSGTVDLGGVWVNTTGEGSLTGSLWNPAVTTLSGSYDFDYTVSNGICPDATSTVTVDIIDCTGLNENDNSRLSVYPNPTPDALTIQGLSIDFGVIEILDMQGKIVMAEDVNSIYGNYLLDMSSIQSGMYVVRVKTEKSTQEVRVVKH